MSFVKLNVVKVTLQYCDYADYKLKIHIQFYRPSYSRKKNKETLNQFYQTSNSKYKERNEKREIEVLKCVVQFVKDTKRFTKEKYGI